MAQDPQIAQLSDEELDALLGLASTGGEASQAAGGASPADSASGPSWLDAAGSWLSQAGGGALNRAKDYGRMFTDELPRPNDARSVLKYFDPSGLGGGLALGESLAQAGKTLAGMGRGEPEAFGSGAVDVGAAMLAKRMVGASLPTMPNPIAGARSALQRGFGQGAPQIAGARPPTPPIPVPLMRPPGGPLRAAGSLGQGGSPTPWQNPSRGALPPIGGTGAPPMGPPSMSAGPFTMPGAHASPLPMPPSRQLPSPPTATPMGIAQPKGLLNPAMPQQMPPQISMQNAQGSALSNMGSPAGAAAPAGAINAQMVYQEFLRLTQQGMSPQEAIRVMGFR